MKEIPLSTTSKTNAGKYFAMVDDDDYGFLMQWKWCANVNQKTIYASRTISENGKRKTIKMHQVVMGTTNSRLLVDHIDHNGLNNQKLNLRTATKRQNGGNRIKKTKASSPFLGVSLHTTKKKRILRDGTTVEKISKSWKAAILATHIGVFKTQEEAARAYDVKAKEIHGEFANLNFK